MPQHFPLTKRGPGGHFCVTIANQSAAAMKRTHSLLLLSATFGAISLASCKKDDPDRDGLSHVNGVPYYHFTDADRTWLQVKQGDEWRFENARGCRRVYRVGGIVENIKAENKEVQPPGPNFSPPKLYNYYDQRSVGINRTDSALTGITLRFARGAAMLTNLNSGGFDANTSQFYAEGEDYEFVGNTDLISDYFNCRGLKFPRGAALNGPFQALTVRGRPYAEVVTFLGSARGSTCAPVPSSYMQELYYDRQAGLVRMVSVAGEVWDRVP